MYQPSFEEYCRLSQEYNLIPVYREYLADTETPVSIYGKLSSGDPSFLLESVEEGTTLARYSFIGTDCFLNFRFHRGRAEFWGSGMKAKLHGGPLEALRGLLSRYRTPRLAGLPRFTGGAAGYFGYDMIRHLEKLPNDKPDPLGLPLCQLMFPGTVLVFDHIRRTLLIVANVPFAGNLEESYQEAVKKIDQVAGRIFTPSASPAYSTLPYSQPYAREKLNQVLAANSSMNRREFEEAVTRALDYIRAGDIFQVVLSQRFSLPFTGDPFDLYRRLRSINPSPYLTYFNFGDLVLVGASPEMLVRVEEGKVFTRPIAGTRPRGKDETEDDLLAAEMLADEKERAEHLMLVDLGRNDVGRVAVPGTVEVPQYMQVERYSHVMHLVSEAKGILEEGKDHLDALGACFPAGTVSGAPKIRAMEIIEELEPLHRGPYAGAVGYVDFAGNMDTAITIRTAVVHRGSAYFQSGAGIVADSDPAKEYEETLHKARAMATAVMAASQREGGMAVAGGH
ncbi:anthranilate synthase component I [Desulforamulus ruminis]|uniref:Anthranilate synthase component 1 n=1 Tax=Desulforamulus ruminis (strain ATCC 23193 / DSM 2154 / NCIMB 8452 / DL) TaxID=696281 RepID=F6DPQ5_DESRL|nr:anthranilate synthase component I [Desulforamulus ruminis]AEG59632.1 anthranilate synthase component I [Desulforamulus ruminis DSM 2154]